MSLSNVREAADNSVPESMRSEFAWAPDEAARAPRFAPLAAELHTDMHEVIGHASGQQAAGFKGTPQGAIKEQFSAIEEARADLVGLYFLADPKLVELGIVSAADQDAIVRAEYESYTRNALLLLRRVREGTQVEEDHDRNRQMIVRWMMANTKAIEERKRDNKTFLRAGGSEGLSRRRRPAADRSTTHQVGRRLRRCQETVGDLRHPLRSQAARRDRGTRPGTQPAVVHRVRDAEADRGEGCRRARSPT